MRSTGEGRRRWAAGALTALALSGAGAIHADTGEASLRPTFELRYGPVARPNPRTGAITTDEPVFAYGGGLALELGLDFAWTATLRYGLSTTGPLLKVAPDADQTRDAWTALRHDLLVGLTWTPSDELTPWIAVEAGAAATWLRDISDRRGASQAVGATLAGRDRWAPAVRAAAGLEWRFADAWGIRAGFAGEACDGLGYAMTVSLAGYRYTQWY